MNNNHNSNNKLTLTKKALNVISVIAGIVLIIIGITGLFLPFVQGILLIVLGLLLIGGKPLLRKAKKLANYLMQKIGIRKK